MSLINFLSLGGTEEVGKNLYLLEVDKDLFILDCGIKYPSVNQYGVDFVLPDFAYIMNNITRVKGIFLSHCHLDHIGGLPHLLRYAKIPVYGTHFTIEVLKSLLEEYNLNVSDYELHEVSYNEELRMGKNKVRFVKVSHSVPGSAFIVIKTLDGNLVYTGNFNLSVSKNSLYSTDYDALLKLREEGVFMLLEESISTTSPILRELNDAFLSKVEKEIKNASGRTIISLFSTNLERIEEVIKIASKLGKKVSIIGKKTQTIVKIALDNNLLDIKEEDFVNLKYITDDNKNDDPNLVCLVCGERHEPYFMLSRMCKGVDRLINIDSNDTVLILTKPHIGVEKLASKTIDSLYRKTDNVVLFDNSLLLSASSSKEECKQMIDILKPKYILPVIGEYRSLFTVKQIALSLGYKPERVIIPSAGNVYSFYDGEYLKVIYSFEPKEINIEGKGSSDSTIKAMNDISDQVTKDRELLASAGVVIFICNINAKERRVMSRPQIINKGFYLDDEMKQKIMEKFNEIKDEYFKTPFLMWDDFKKDLKRAITSLLYEITKSAPLVIPNVISTEK